MTPGASLDALAAAISALPVGVPTEGGGDFSVMLATARKQSEAVTTTGPDAEVSSQGQPTSLIAPVAGYGSLPDRPIVAAGPEPVVCETSAATGAADAPVPAADPTFQPVAADVKLVPDVMTRVPSGRAHALGDGKGARRALVPATMPELPDGSKFWAEPDAGSIDHDCHDPCIVADPVAAQPASAETKPVPIPIASLIVTPALTAQTNAPASATPAAAISATETKAPSPRVASKTAKSMPRSDGAAVVDGFKLAAVRDQAIPVVSEKLNRAEPLLVRNAADSPMLLPIDLQPRTFVSVAHDAVSSNAGSSNADRGQSAFFAQIATLARDVMVVSSDKDVRFNVRPETLGPVAVTIERGNDGPVLRMSVETPFAVQVVRHAEPMLSDAAARSGAPFVQVSVDLNAPGQRERAPRAALMKRSRGIASQPLESIATAKTGRFA